MLTCLLPNVVMTHMSSLYTSVCVVIHNKGTGVDKISWENEITLTRISNHDGVLTFHPSPEISVTPLKHTRVVTTCLVTELSH